MYAVKDFVLILHLLLALSLSSFVFGQQIRWSANLTQSYPNRVNAQCATRVLATNTSTQLWLIGGQSPSGQSMTDVWRNGASADAAAWTLVKGGFPISATATVLIQDVLIVLGSSGASNRVWYSANGGASWGISTVAAPWSVSQYAYAAVPYANALILTAGYLAPNGIVWMSTDGIGALWKNTTPTTIAPWPTSLQSASLVALFDGSPSQAATIVLSGGFATSSYQLSNIVYISTDYGYNWQVTVASWPRRYLHTTMADTDNNIYVYGGCIAASSGSSCNTYDNNVFLSTDTALSWTPFSAVSTLPLLSSTCVSLIYVPIKGAPNKYNKQIVIYSGAYVGTPLQYVGAFIGDVSTVTNKSPKPQL